MSPLTISKTHAQNKLSQVSLTETEKGITLSWEASLQQDEEITSYQLKKNGQTAEKSNRQFKLKKEALNGIHMKMQKSNQTPRIHMKLLR